MENKQRELRSLVVLEPKEEGYIVEGYATKWEPYLLYEMGGQKTYERVDRNAFDEADMRDVIMQYDHSGKVFARQSNGTLELKIDDVGLFIRADLSKSQASRELYEEIKAGLITKMSWAFTIKEHSWDEQIRLFSVLKVKKVFDVSAVSIPANPDSEINARTFVLDGVIQQMQQELLERKKKEFVLIMTFEKEQ
jgi:hypothetical protein